MIGLVDSNQSSSGLPNSQVKPRVKKLVNKALRVLKGLLRRRGESYSFDEMIAKSTVVTVLREHYVYRRLIVFTAFRQGRNYEVGNTQFFNIYFDYHGSRAPSPGRAQSVSRSTFFSIMRCAISLDYTYK